MEGLALDNSATYERDQGSSFPIAGSLLLHQYDVLIVAPATSNTVAKIAHGISDSLVTTMVAHALKSHLPVGVMPTDWGVDQETLTPYTIKKELCKCSDCPPATICPQHAIHNGEINLLRCNGCGDCVPACPYHAIGRGKVKVIGREIDRENIQQLKDMGIKVVHDERELFIKA
jgi:dihydromethanopterin reductase (acceptor)